MDLDLNWNLEKSIFKQKWCQTNKSFKLDVINPAMSFFFFKLSNWILVLITQTFTSFYIDRYLLMYINFKGSLNITWKKTVINFAYGLDIKVKFD